MSPLKLLSKIFWASLTLSYEMAGSTIIKTHLVLNYFNSLWNVEYSVESGVTPPVIGHKIKSRVMCQNETLL